MSGGFFRGCAGILLWMVAILLIVSSIAGALISVGGAFFGKQNALGERLGLAAIGLVLSVAIFFGAVGLIALAEKIIEAGGGTRTHAKARGDY